MAAVSAKITHLDEEFEQFMTGEDKGSVEDDDENSVSRSSRRSKSELSRLKSEHSVEKKEPPTIEERKSSALAMFGNAIGAAQGAGTKKPSSK